MTEQEDSKEIKYRVDSKMLYQQTQDDDVNLGNNTCILFVCENN